MSDRASNPHPHVPVPRFDPGVPPEEGARRFYQTMNLRRSVRAFSNRPVSRETIEWIVRAAGTAPSGANKQPWRFVCVDDPELKHEIRTGAEAEERVFYERRAPAEWLADLAPLGTDAEKPFLEIAPWIIVVFKLVHEVAESSDKRGKIYYAEESIGIATGMLLAAVHHAGLVALTHTPSPMKFLSTILERPSNERPYLVIPIGYPREGCEVPDIARKPIEDIMVQNR